MNGKHALLLLCVLIPLRLPAEGVAEPAHPEAAEIDLSDPCLACHDGVSPGIVQTFRLSRHAFAGVSCASCHSARDGDPSGTEHFGATVTTVPSPAYCGQCHPGEVAQNGRSKHAWTAFIGNLKPYYQKARSLGLDPLSQETARRLDPQEMARRTVSALFPDSGLLEKIGLLEESGYSHGNIPLGCARCHGSFLLATGEGKLAGWPNNGVGRVNPDGTLGSCSACHTRHRFSVAEARKPHTCGQCHLGPDHPQIEIYQESKHGNIFAARGGEWSWEEPAGQWGPRDIEAPTCATCHFSGFGGKLQTTHDVGERLYWELQAPASVPQWKNADQVQDLVLQRVPDPQGASEGRARMKSVCGQCHAGSWIDGYFEQFDAVVRDYNLLWERADGLLREAYAEGLADPANPLDETPEVLHYLIWHHSGRRWRMGAAMMGPDWTNWNGAIDTVTINLGAMIDDLEARRELKELSGR